MENPADFVPRRCFVVGVGMTKFSRPFARKWDYPDMVKEAGEKALEDAGLSFKDIDVAVASYCYAEPTAGERAVYELGMTGIPVFNTNNNCSSASSALMMAKTFILSGIYECALVAGFEKMERGLSMKYKDKENPVRKHFDHMIRLGAKPGLLLPHFNEMTSDVIKLFAYAAKEHCSRYNTESSHFAKIAYKNRRHGLNNPYACVQSDATIPKILNSTKLCDPITAQMSAPTADGSAVAILCSESFLKRHGLEKQAVEIIAQQMVTDLPSSFGDSYVDLCGYSMAKRAADDCYRSSGLSVQDVDLFEVHDCFSCNELFMYEALGLCQQGLGRTMVDQAKWITNAEGGSLCQIGGRWVVNPSGGLECKGHPIGATGLAQCAEISWQLRNLAGKRQVPGARIGCQHNFGIGGAAVVTLYKKYDLEDSTHTMSKL